MPDPLDSDTSKDAPRAAPDNTVVQDGFPQLARDPSAPAAPPGYELLAEIGRGGMGVVYRARDLALNRDVAVKVLQDRFPPDGPAARQFVEEAQITGQLTHPGVPPVHQVGALSDGRPFLVMKLIKGHTLDVILTQNPGPARLLDVFEHLCATVGYAHTRGVIHRDLKPSNVMVGAFGEVQVMDWGLAKVLRPSEPTPTPVESGPAPAVTPHSELRVPHSDDTIAGSVMGTPAFMSPEQAGGELHKIDRRADVFALGGILCALLTGRGPYTGADGTEVHLKAVRGQTGEALAALDASGANPALIALCKRCLSADPADRPRDGDEVAAEVARVRAAEVEVARSSPAVPVLPARAKVSRRWVLGAGVCAVAAGGTGLFFALRKPRPGPAPGGGPDPAPGEVPPAVLVPVRQVEGRATAVAVSDDGRWLAVALTDDDRPNDRRGVKLFDRSAGAAPEVWWKWRDVECRGVAFSPDGALLAVAAGGSGRVRIWNFKQEKELDLPGAAFSGTTRAVAFSPDGKLLAAAIDQWDNEDRTPRPGIVRVWTMGAGAPPRDHVRLNFPTRSVAFASDNTTLVAGMSGRTNDWVPSVEVWNAATGGHLRALNAPLSVVGPTVACARTAPVCATTDREGVKLYKLPSFAPLEHEFATDGEPTAVAVRPDGAVVAFALNGTVALCDVGKGGVYKTFEKVGEYAAALAFTADGKTLIAGADRTVHEWPVPNPP